MSIERGSAPKRKIKDKITHIQDNRKGAQRLKALLRLFTWREKYDNKFKEQAYPFPQFCFIEM